MTSPIGHGTAGRDIEAEANAFAMALLMPADWLREDIVKLGGIDIEDERAVKKLAAKYRVSVQVMTIRIGQILGLLNEEDKQ